MDVVSVDAIDYCVCGDEKAIVQSWNNLVTVALPRNHVAVNGRRLTVADLRTST
jgi:hypothetical protein